MRNDDNNDRFADEARRAFEHVRGARLVGFKVLRSAGFSRLLLQFVHDERGDAHEIEIYADVDDRIVRVAAPIAIAPPEVISSTRWCWRIIDGELVVAATRYYAPTDLAPWAPVEDLLHELVAHVVVMPRGDGAIVEWRGADGLSDALRQP